MPNEFVIKINRDVTNIFRERTFTYRSGPRVEWSQELEFLTGRLYNVGGKVNSNFHLEREEETVKVKCTQEEAKRVNQYLYGDIFIVARKRWKPSVEPEYTFVDCYGDQSAYRNHQEFYERIKANDSLERYDLIYDRVAEILKDESKAYSEIVPLCRLFNFEFSDRGALRTILMAIKPVKDRDPQLLEWYQKMATTLRKGSTHNRV